MRSALFFAAAVADIWDEDVSAEWTYEDDFFFPRLLNVNASNSTAPSSTAAPATPAPSTAAPATPAPSTAAPATPAPATPAPAANATAAPDVNATAAPTTGAPKEPVQEQPQEPKEPVVEVTPRPKPVAATAEAVAEAFANITGIDGEAAAALSTAVKADDLAVIAQQLASAAGAEMVAQLMGEGFSLGSSTAEVLQTVGGTVFKTLNTQTDVAPTGTERVEVAVKLTQSGSLACANAAECEVALVVAGASVEAATKDTDVCHVVVPEHCSCTASCAAPAPATPMCKNALEILSNMQSGVSSTVGSQDTAKAPLCTSYLAYENFATARRRRLSVRQLTTQSFSYELLSMLPVFVAPAQAAAVQAIANDPTQAAAFASAVGTELADTLAASQTEVASLPAAKMDALLAKVQTAAAAQSVTLPVGFSATEVTATTGAMVAAAPVVTVEAAPATFVAAATPAPTIPVVTLTSGSFSLSAVTTVASAIVAAAMSF